MPRPAGRHPGGVRGVTGPNWQERPIVFSCEGDRLIGIAALPDRPGDTGLVIVVGGPQYRAGSHRQFTLLARHLAGENIASLRFDYRGMGDSEGDRRDFERIDADIRAAVDALLEQAPGLTKIILWGLCDAASASLFYGYTDSRICGMVLLNPWAHTEQKAAEVRLKHYYLTRLMQRSFWTKLLSREFEFKKSLAGLLGSISSLITPLGITKQATSTECPQVGTSYIDRMLRGLQNFHGNTLLIFSENDLTAKEFLSLAESSAHWKAALQNPRIRLLNIPQANHTFASELWRNQAAKASSNFSKNYCNSGDAR